MYDQVLYTACMTFFVNLDIACWFGIMDIAFVLSCCWGGGGSKSQLRMVRVANEVGFHRYYSIEYASTDD